MHMSLVAATWKKRERAQGYYSGKPMSQCVLLLYLELVQLSLALSSPVTDGLPAVLVPGYAALAAVRVEVDAVDESQAGAVVARLGIEGPVETAYGLLAVVKTGLIVLLPPRHFIDGRN